MTMTSISHALLVDPDEAEEIAEEAVDGETENSEA